MIPVYNGQQTLSDLLRQLQPVLVNGRSEVLTGHVRRSSAGLYYENYAEFVEATRLMLEDEGLRSRLGRNGAEYVTQNYSHGSVRQRYLALLERIVQLSSGGGMP